MLFRLWIFSSLFAGMVWALPPTLGDSVGHDWTKYKMPLVPTSECPLCRSERARMALPDRPYTDVEGAIESLSLRAQCYGQLDPCENMQTQFERARTEILPPLLERFSGSVDARWPLVEKLIKLMGDRHLHILFRRDLLGFIKENTLLRTRGIYYLLRCPTTPQPARVHFLNLLHAESSMQWTQVEQEDYQRYLRAAQLFTTAMDKKCVTSLRLQAAWDLNHEKCAELVEEIFLDMLDLSVLEGEEEAIMKVVAQWPEKVVGHELEILKAQTAAWLVYDIFGLDGAQAQRLMRIIFPKRRRSLQSQSAAPLVSTKGDLKAPCQGGR